MFFHSKSIKYILNFTKYLCLNDVRLCCECGRIWGKWSRSDKPTNCFRADFLIIFRKYSCVVAPNFTKPESFLARGHANITKSRTFDPQKWCPGLCDNKICKILIESFSLNVFLTKFVFLDPFESDILQSRWKYQYRSSIKRKWSVTETRRSIWIVARPMLV